MLRTTSSRARAATLDRAIANYRAGNFNEAIALLQPFAAMDAKQARKWPDFKAALVYLAGSLAESGRFRDALEVQARLMWLTPGDPEARANIIKLLRASGANVPASGTFRLALCKVLDQEGVAEFVVEAAFAQLGDHVFQAGMDRVLQATDEELAASLSNGKDFEFLLSPLLLRLMPEAVIPVPEYERFFRKLRRGILLGSEHADCLRSSKAFFKTGKDFLGAFAQYLWMTEYALFADDTETALVCALRQRLEAALANAFELDPGMVFDLTRYALYEPWHRLEGSDALFAIPLPRWPSHIRPLLTEWLNVREETALRSAVQRLTPIAGGVSEKVRQQYEEHPYPRWKHRLATVDRLSAARLIGHLCPAATVPERFARPVDILVAGCGTGLEAFNWFTQVQTASILAIDLSTASLAYAIRMARQLAIGEGIAFRQADILKLDGVDRSFDLIASSGVLHHLEDPLAGWRILTERLRPGGILQIGLYSEYAGQTVLRARELIARAAWEVSPDRMRTLRKEILDGRYDELALLPNWRDFYTLSMFRDLVFHVNEHRFTIPRIEDALTRLGLRFVGMAQIGARTRERYRQQFPEDPAGLKLENWAAFEERHPLTFVNMYNLFLQKPE